MKEKDMLCEYDFTDSVKNPYTNRLKKAVTIRIESTTIDYFKGLSKEYGIPYQTLINLYLVQCAVEKKKPELVWS